LPVTQPQRLAVLTDAGAICDTAWPGIGGRQEFLQDLFSVLPAGSGVNAGFLSAYG
jgi:hypothetical protein